MELIKIIAHTQRQQRSTSQSSGALRLLQANSCNWPNYVAPSLFEPSYTFSAPTLSILSLSLSASRVSYSYACSILCRIQPTNSTHTLDGGHTRRTDNFRCLSDFIINALSRVGAQHRVDEDGILCLMARWQIVSYVLFVPGRGKKIRLAHRSDDDTAQQHRKKRLFKTRHIFVPYGI